MTHESTLLERRREMALFALAGVTVRYFMVIDYREITVELSSPSYEALMAARRICLATAQHRSAAWQDDQRDARKILAPSGKAHYGTWLKFDVPHDVDLLAALTHDLEYCGVAPGDEDMNDG